MRRRDNIKLRRNLEKFSRVCWLGCVYLSLISSAEAHSDPRGDIHPQVLVVDGKFSIVFNSSHPEKVSEYTEGKSIQQMIYTAEGKLFAPRHPLERKRSHEELGPVGIYGRKTQLGESTVIFQENRSGYLLKSPEGKITRVRLPWPKNVAPDLLEDVLVVPEGIAMTGKEMNSTRDGGPLKFYWIEHDSTNAPMVLTIGATACIYYFPVASNVAFAGGRFWVAYMRPTENKELKLSLWSWKPGEKEGRVEDLDSPAYWNSHLSIAAIGDHLCLAYHCVTDHQYPGHARIVTVFRKAK